MKKFFVILTTVLVMVLIGINLCDTATAKEFTDEELVETFLLDEYGDDYDELVINRTDDKYVYYMTYCDDEVNHCGCINRSYYTHKYE